MKYLMLVLDGLGDEAIEELNYLTPFEAAQTTNINYIKENGAYGTVNTVPHGFEAESLCCILNLLGVNSKFIPNGRAYLEAISEGIDLSSNDTVFRCNLVNLSEEAVISNKDFSKIKDNFYYSNEQMEFYHMSSYKNLLVIKNKITEDVMDFPPHCNWGKNINELIPKIEILEDFYKQTKNDKYAFLPWGRSTYSYIPSFEDIYNLKAASVCTTEIVKGISLAMKMKIADLKNGTADIDTDLEEKVQATFKLLENNDFVLLHINGLDEAAHRKSYKEKVEFLKLIDDVVVGELIRRINDETRILICSDHSSLCKYGKHDNSAQDFWIYDTTNSIKGNLGNLDGNNILKRLIDN